MPLDFIHYVESGVNHLGSDDWLTPASVHGLADADFVTLPPVQREELFRAVDRFRTIATTAPPVSPAQEEIARAALVTVWNLLRPYRTPESTAIREAIWRVWDGEKDRIPTFDYELAESWTGSPIVWVWLVLRDDTEIEAPETRELLGRVRMAIRLEFERAGIERWPNIGVRTESDVRDLAARAPA
ncbi:hypothetical protein J8F10_22205 [Gemmata sp. G18]|uniref:Uncharacterized protein n=1 Tax=Gemmata palustris TaxID=2822762 RepID=A0ABS5BW68_9BACT|nr:hypothetical protein [Gemmata palustris]MBP3957977.1 hypothetical protein [Gemmata palustris]